MGPMPSPSAIYSLSGSVTNSWIQERVGQIHEEIDHHEGEGRDEGEALHLLVVAGDDGVDAEGAGLRPHHGLRHRGDQSPRGSDLHVPGSKNSLRSLRENIWRKATA